MWFISNKRNNNNKRKNRVLNKRENIQREKTEKNQMWQKTKMNQNTAGRVVVVEGAQRAPTKDKREGKTQKRKTLQIRKNNQSEKTNF